MPVNLNYNIQGDGEPIIILHGLFGSSRNWRSIANKLSDSYKVITADLRNHGQSDHHESMSYFEMADDLHALIGNLCMDRVSLIGHSMGGKVAMIYALRNSEIIKQLIILDIAPITYEHKYGKLFFAMNSLLLDSIKHRKMAEQAMDQIINDTWMSQFLLQNLVRTDQGFNWRLNLTAIEANIESISGFPDFKSNCKYDRPALFLGGVNSDFITIHHHETIRNYFPDAQIKMIEQAGHMLHIEQPESVLKAISNFLSNY